MGCTRRKRSHYDRPAARARVLVGQGSTLEEAAREVGCSTKTLRRRGVPSSRYAPDAGTAAVPALGESLAEGSAPYMGGLLSEASTQGREEPALRDGAEGSSLRMDAVMRATAAEILDNASRGRVVPEGLKRTAEDILGEDPPPGGAEGLSSAEMEGGAPQRRVGDPQRAPGRRTQTRGRTRGREPAAASLRAFVWFHPALAL